MKPMRGDAYALLTIPERLKLRGMGKHIPPFDPDGADRALETAKTYLSARESGRAFEYSGGKTFLNAYPVNSPTGTGLIDCSTYLILVLLQIPFERSPYAAPGLRSFEPSQLEAKGETELLTGKNGGVVRFAADLAEYYFRKGRCFTDRAQVRPGDLSFHCGTEGHSRRFMNVTHIGIVSEDAEHIYNVTSIPKKVVVVTPVAERPDLLFYARPEYAGESCASSCAEISKN